jgi:cation diffusion facilitator CzcD-associated flavoprotein CzcO
MDAALESLAPGCRSRPALLKPLEWLVTKHIERAIDDPDLVAKLTPHSSIGGKRILVSDDYYPTLARPDVEVITGGVREVRASSIVDGDGTERHVDVIVHATGVHVTDAYDRLEIRGRDGRMLREVWAEHGRATHLGMTVSDFPNLFFLLGPDTGLGRSAVFTIECRTHYVAQAIRTVHDTGMGGLDVRAEVQQRSHAAVRRRRQKDLPGSAVRYWLETRRFDPEDFEFFGRAADTAEDAPADASVVTPAAVPVAG